MPTAENQAETPQANGPGRSLVRRVLGLPARMWAFVRGNILLSVMLLCGSGIIGATALSLAYYAVHRGVFTDREATIQAALERLDAGHFDEAKDLAERLRQKMKDHFAEQGYPMFVQGAALAYQASELPAGEERQVLFLVAARYLQEAGNRSFPPGREKEGRYLLATSLFHSGHYAESLRPLLKAVDDDPQASFELYRQLSMAYLRDGHPNLEQALKYNRLWLDDPAMNRDERDEAYVQQSEILLLRGDTAGCHEAVARVEEDSPLHAQALIILARVLMLEGDTLTTGRGSEDPQAEAGREKYRQAIGALERSLSQHVASDATPQARYLLGVAYEKLGDLREALSAFERARTIHYRTPEALAATVAEAEIVQAQGRGAQALDLWKKAVEEIGDTESYANMWLSLRELRSRLVAGQKLFRDHKDFAAAVALVETFVDAFPPDEVALAKAQTEKSWAEYLLQSTAGQDAMAAEVTEAEARRRFRLAGEQYRLLATMRFATSEYPDDLWESGHCFLRGQNYTMAVRMLQEYLRNAPKKLSPHGWVGLGEAQLALGRYQEALHSLHECIDSAPNHPESYRARILASQAYQELGELQKAQALLVENLDNSSLEPPSIPWKQSQYERGKLLYRQAVREETEGRQILLDQVEVSKRQPGLQKLLAADDLYQQSIDTLGMAIRRYQSDSESLQAMFLQEATLARYNIAEAHRRSASILRESLSAEPTQTRRTALTHTMREYLRESAAAHHDLQERLIRKQNQGCLSPVELSMLRNTYFAYADALFDLEDYDGAIAAYSAATNRYQHEPEALEALMQVAECYRRLHLPAEAHGTLLQAQSVLSRIRPDADFTKTTRYRKEQWQNVLAWLSQL